MSKSEHVARILDFEAANQATVLQPLISELRGRVSSRLAQGAQDSIVRRVRTPDPCKTYYSARLYLNDLDEPEWSVFTGCMGNKSRQPAIEMRDISEVVPKIVLSNCRQLGEKCNVVATEDHLADFYLVGGNALIESDLARHMLQFLLKPIACRPAGTFGYLSAARLPHSAFQPAPNRKLRGWVMERDWYKCRICGRSPRDYIDLELHVHHIRPWKNGGATVEDNLITLCQTCHGGLEPHFKHALFDLIGANQHIKSRERRLAEVGRYEEWAMSSATSRH